MEGISFTRLTPDDASARQPRRRGTVIDFAIDRPFPVPEEVVRRTIPAIGIGFLGGQSGALKTFTALELAFCLMTGQPFAGRKVVRTGGVIFCAFEGAGTIEGRVKARRSRLADPAAPLPLRVLTSFGPLFSDRDYADFAAVLDREAESLRAAHGLDVAAVMIDTVAAAGMIAEDKENDPAAWQKIFDRLNPVSARLSAPIIAIHHFGKDRSAGLRGSSNNRAAAEFVLAVTCERDETTGETSDHQLALTKSRTGPEGPIARINKTEVEIGTYDDGEAITSLVLEFDTDPRVVGEDMPPMGVCRQMQQAIHEGWEAKNPLSNSPQTKHSGRYAPRYLAQQFHLNHGVVQRLLDSWIDNEIVAVEVCNTDTKKRGLRVLQWL